MAEGLLRKHSIILVLVLLSYFGGFVLNAILANLLEPIDYGDISVVLQMLFFLAPFALFGTEISVIRFLPKYLKDKQYGKVNGFLRWAAEIIFATACVIFLCSSFAVFLSMILQEGGAQFERWHIWVYSIWLVPIYSFMIILANILQSLGKYYYSATFDGIKGAGVTFLMAAFVFVFWRVFEGKWFGRDQLRFSVVFVIALAMIVIALYELTLLKIHVPKEVWKAEPEFERKEWTSTSVKMLFSSVIYIGFTSVAFVLIELLAKDPVAVAHFAAILTITSSIAVISSVLDILVNPEIAPALEENRHADLQKFINKVNVYKMIPALIFYAIFIVFGKELLGLFGKAFVDAYPSMLILGFGMLVALSFCTAGAMMVYSGHQKEGFYLSVVQLGILVVGDLLFVPFFGLYAACGVYVVCLCVTSLLQSYLVRKYTGIRSFFLL